MTDERGLTWSGKWHIVNPDHPAATRYSISRCGAYLYRDDDPQYPAQLKRIKDGTKKSTGDCKLCNRSVGIKTATVELPEPESESPHSWIDGSVTATRGLWRVRVYLEDHRMTSAEARQVAAALLAAADIAEADAL